MKIPGHIALCTGAAALLLGVPFLLSDGFAELVNGTDAVSSASAVIDAPSGNFTVLINRDCHKSESDMAAWHEFFSGGDFDIIFDDTRCTVLDGDTNALTMAESFMSRLPENQMTVQSGDPVLVLSKADHGRFDMMILSDEAAESFAANSVYDGKNVDVIRISDKEPT